MAYVWNWQVFCKSTVDSTTYPSCFGQGGDITYLDWLMSAWGWTVAVFIGAWLIALAVGMVIGTLRTLPSRPLSTLGSVWVEVFRNIPLLVQVFLWYHVIPTLVPPLKAVPPFALVVVALGLFTSARIAEHLRAGIQSLPRGQLQAAKAMGLTLPQAYRHVMLPNALRIALPPLTSEAMSLVKNTSVAFAVSIAELVLYARQAQEETSRGIEVYLAVTLLYVITAMIVNRILVFIEKRSRIPGQIGAAAH